MMPWRMATLNLKQNHKRWDARRELVIDQLGALQPDVVALNEICLTLQTGRWLQRAARERLGVTFALVQQSKVNGSSLIDGEALLTRYPVVETANRDDRTLDAVAQVARLDLEGRLLDVYVTHLYRSRGDDVLRLYQVQQLLAWIQTCEDVEAQVVCGDFNATSEMPAAQLMASVFRPTQTAPTAYTPLQDTDSSVSHPYWARFDRCIDYIWVAGPLAVHAIRIDPTQVVGSPMPFSHLRTGLVCLCWHSLAVACLWPMKSPIVRRVETRCGMSSWMGNFRADHTHLASFQMERAME
jgi:endonuclease/exonuclease/phosphatase family metal-dependent hydrolase